MVRTSSILKPIEECVFEMAEVVVVVVNPIIRGGPGSLFEQGGELAYSTSSRPHTITFAEIIGRKAPLVTDKLAQNHLLTSN